MREVSWEGISPGFPLEPEALVSATDVAGPHLLNVGSRVDGLVGDRGSFIWMMS